MKEISINKIFEINEYWLVYRQDSGEPGHIQLSACANTYHAHHGGEGKTLGLHYEEDGCGWYELFTAGHLRIKCPLRANFGQAVVATFRGKKPKDAMREEYEAIEQQFQSFGWNTVERQTN